MRSIGKYDLLETIAGGDVEVFLAEEIRTRLRRLVCIVGWKDDPKQPGARDILQAFRRLAPDPPGVIIDSGQDQASRSVYLVTSYPSDPLAIETWVKAYRALTEKRTGVAPTGKVAVSDDVTQAWTPEPPAKAVPIVPKRPKQEQVGEFTRMFHERGPTPVPAADERSPQFPDLGANEKPSAPGSFTREFFASVPAPPEHSPKRESHSKTGEFTKFFRGGFNAPPEQPPAEAEHFPAPATGKREGEFTKMFNSPSQPPASSYESEPGFTPVFDRGAVPQDPGAFNRPVKQEPIRPPALQPGTSGRGGQFAAPKFDATNVDRGDAPAQGSAPVAPPSAVPRPMWGNEERSEQSRVFTPAPVEPVVSRPPTPAGPSEFTRVISGGPRNAPPPPVDVPAAPASPPPPAPALPAFAPPAVAMPQAPPVPQAPPAPQVAFQAPAAPQVAAPQLAAPQVPAPTSKPASYLPLIIVLNVVLVIAIALILYFALKPH